MKFQKKPKEARTRRRLHAKHENRKRKHKDTERNLDVRKRELDGATRARRAGDFRWIWNQPLLQ